MKKLTFIAALFLATTFAFSQTPLSTAIDFTVTDIEGNDFNLFEKLAEGQYVCIDFFYTTCPACTGTVPYLNDAYELFGCNTADVFMISIASVDNDTAVIAYHEQLGLLFPSVSGVEGGGDTINSIYEINAWPTYILIAPDHSIVEQNMWPIPNTNEFIDYFESNGIEQTECGNTSITEFGKKLMELYPNPTTGVFEMELNYEGKFTIQVISVLGDVIYETEGTANGNYQNSIDLSGMESGVYFVLLKSNDETIVKKLQLLSK